MSLHLPHSVKVLCVFLPQLCVFQSLIHFVFLLPSENINSHCGCSEDSYCNFEFLSWGTFSKARDATGQQHPLPHLQESEEHYQTLHLVISRSVSCEGMFLHGSVDATKKLLKHQSSVILSSAS